MNASLNRSGIRLKTALLALLAAGSLQAQPASIPAPSVTTPETAGAEQPEGASGRQTKPVVRARYEYAESGVGSPLSAIIEEFARRNGDGRVAIVADVPRRLVAQLQPTAR